MTRLTDAVAARLAAVETMLGPPGRFDAYDALTSLLAAVERPSWHADAACRGTTEVRDWFPERGQNVSRQRALCQTCTVAEQCLDYALADPGIVGIWAGTTSRDRQKMRAGAARRSAAVPAFDAA